MQVIYKDNIIEKLNKAIDTANNIGKKIKVIKLTKEEWDEYFSILLINTGIYNSKDPHFFNGIYITQMES